MRPRQPTVLPVRCARTALASASLCLIQRWFCRLQWGITTLPHDTDGEVLCAPMTESRPDRATYYNGPVRHGMTCRLLRCKWRSSHYGLLVGSTKSGHVGVQCDLPERPMGVSIGGDVGGVRTQR